MARKSKSDHSEENKIEVSMTPMIDIVFMLLIFFLVTFKIIVPEGDFSIHMPIERPSEGLPDDEEKLTITINLLADSSGRLRKISYGERTLWSGNANEPSDAEGGYKSLRDSIKREVMPGGKENPAAIETTEVDIDCDYNLKFAFVIEAMTRICGYTTQRPNGEIIIHRLVKKVRLKPPRLQR